MAKKKKDTLSPTGNETTSYIETRNYLLQNIKFEDVKNAWFTLSHLLLPDGAKVLDMGCGDGLQTYIMAALNPNVKFIGVDKSQKVIREAQENFQIKNLEYMVGDISGDLFDPESIDVIINAYTLHKVFSEARYNERIVRDTLRKQFSMLKNNGTMFIRDYAKPAADNDFVLLEMHDEYSDSDDLQEMSEVELLIWYSEHARPKQDPGCGGFFLEELEPRFPRTRLFRLPYKWAYEFIMRKDNRDIWDSHLPFEYIFYTPDEFKRELRSLGARVQYSAPHWDDDYIRKNFEGHFRLIDGAGDALNNPPTSFIAVAHKLPEKMSLNVKERRISHDGPSRLKVKTVRNQTDGALVDIVTRGKEISEILPYRLSDDGQLYVYLHEGVIRGITNSVRRAGLNIDGREWSGHMLEAISTDYEDILSLGKISPGTSQKFTKNMTGLKIQKGGLLEEGPTYYPDPNYIDERVHSYYIPLQAKNPKVLKPSKTILEPHNFQEKGRIKEYKAQAVLDAITVGLIPNSRLELQLLSLMQHLGVKAENWVSKEINIASGKIDKTFKVREFLRRSSGNDKRFKEVKNAAGQLKTVNSIFVEEGQTQGSTTGLSSGHVDFVLSDEKTINTAVILPLTKSEKGDIHAGFNINYMPVPQRFEGNGLSISAPYYNIPKEIKNYKMLKQFIAEKFGVTPNQVLKLGESYFTHIGITPQRIHPFAIIAPPKAFKDPGTKFMPVYQYMMLWKSISKEQHFMTVLARAYRYLPEHMKLQAKQDVKLILDDIFREAQPDWSMPGHVSPVKFESKKDIEIVEDDTIGDAIAEHNLSSLRSSYEAAKKKKSENAVDLPDTSDMDEKMRLEEENKELKKEAAKHLDLNLIEDFEAELDDIRQALEEENENNPKPEEW